MYLYTEPPAATKDAIGIITASAIGLDWVVVEGTTTAALKSGAGHMSFSPLPGQPGNSVISGHRTTYGAPFNRIGELVSGDLIVWESPTTGTHTYMVRETVIVSPDDLWVLDDRAGAWITLTTCHPKYSSRQRLIVFAEMVAGPNMPAVTLIEKNKQG